jgi:hypothetical protein
MEREKKQRKIKKFDFCNKYFVSNGEVLFFQKGEGRRV